MVERMLVSRQTLQHLDANGPVETAVAGAGASIRDGAGVTAIARKMSHVVRTS